MNDFKIIEDIIIILLVSLPIIFIFNKLNIPGIIGFLIAGMIIGPFGFKFITDTSMIRVMAEVGIMLLLFTVGLEVSYTRIVQIKKYLLFAGGLQLTGTILLAALIFLAIGMEPKESFIFGILICFSSTAIVLKLLADKDELESLQGRISLGILIFQDISIVPLSLLILLIGASENLSFVNIILEIVVSFGLTAVIIVISKYLIPHIMHQVARLRIREVFTAGVILLLLGISYLTHTLGLSFALGAFIVGLMLAESDYNHQIVSEIQPFKSVFNSIFFVSIGLLLNLNFVIDNFFAVTGTALLILIFKTLVIFLIILLMKYPVRIALVIAFGLAQVGEFSFILAEMSFNYELLDRFYFNTFLAVTILTMILTPFIFKLLPAIATGSSKQLIKTGDKNKIDHGMTDHVIIVGYGLNGRNLARVLRETGLKYVIVEMNPDTVKSEKAKGEKIIYGDAANQEILHKAGLDNARIIVFAISDSSATKIALRNCKKICPGIYTLVRTRYVSEIDELKRLGADIIIPEEFETSLLIFRRVLEKYSIPLNVIMQQVNILRQESYKLLIKPDADIASLSHLDEILARDLTETYFITETNSFIDKTLSELNLRAETDATILAIVREGNVISNPSGREKILLNDTIVITGTHLSVSKAMELLDS